MRKLRRSEILVAAGMIPVVLALATLLAQRPLPRTLAPQAGAEALAPVLDRRGERLTASYQSRWNLDDRLALERVPFFLRTAVIEAEDRRFWTHRGVDWRARLSALWQNLRAGRAVRGASTITEQVVRLLHPRPRTLWSRWVEGFEAMRLERRFSKSEILEFYLNQVPYGANRRGVVQAARYYFGREPETLSREEMLALAVLPRAPARLDPWRTRQGLAAPLRRLARRMRDDGLLSAQDLAALGSPPPVREEDDAVPAAHFLAALRARAVERYGGAPPAVLRSSLDAQWQRAMQRLLDNRLRELASAGARQAALLVVDLHGRKVRVWATAALGTEADEIGLDPVLVPRQPGSALKPLLYALALTPSCAAAPPTDPRCGLGWSAATRIEDDALAAHVGGGLHPYRNYSRLHYGTVSVREALGNSLNIPAVKTLQAVGGARFLALLRALGMKGLTRSSDWYGDGLALGNGEVTLDQMVQAYAALADRGRFQPLTLFEDEPAPRPLNLLDPKASSIVADILSDPQARLLEFGAGGLLRFPGETAVKTGTSSDYRDAWCLAYDARYVAGAWFGNLDGGPMDGVTGAIGPALLLRSVFAMLDRETPPQPLWRSPRLVRLPVHDEDGGQRMEWFAPGTAPPVQATSIRVRAPQLTQPFDGLRLAFDPRVPSQLQALPFELDAAPPGGVRWYVDGQPVAQTETPRYLWPLVRGAHRAYAAFDEHGIEQRTAEVRFEVR